VKKPGPKALSPATITIPYLHTATCFRFS